MEKRSPLELQKWQRQGRNSPAWPNPHRRNACMAGRGAGCTPRTTLQAASRLADLLALPLADLARPASGQPRLVCLLGCSAMALWLAGRCRWIRGSGIEPDAAGPFPGFMAATRAGLLNTAARCGRWHPRAA